MVTLGELRAALASNTDLPDDTHVVIEDWSGEHELVLSTVKGLAVASYGHPETGETPCLIIERYRDQAKTTH